MHLENAAAINSVLPINTGCIKVSVVLCTYNGAVFINEQIDTIVKQTYPLYEVIIVDDCSSDDTLVLVEAWASRHPYIKLFKNDVNLGYNKNFEKAMKLATGDVIAISDQDDIWHHKKIETLLSHWQQETLLIHSDTIVFDGDVPAQPQPNKFLKRFSGTNPRRLALYNTVYGHAAMIKKELLAVALPFNADAYYDWWLAVVAACNGGVSYCPEILVFQRVHSQNVSIKKGLTKTERLLLEKKMVANNIRYFTAAPNMKEEDKFFFKKLYSLWENAMMGNNKKDLFFFLMRHRKNIYFSKPRSMALPSQIKRSLRYSFTES